MKNLLGWKWTLGYVVAAALVGCMIVTILSIGTYLVLVFGYLGLSTFWRIVEYYTRVQSWPEFVIVAIAGMVGYLSLMRLLSYSKKIIRETEK